MENTNINPKEVRSGTKLTRRTFMAFLSALGVCSTPLTSLATTEKAKEMVLSLQDISQAEKVAGLDFSEAERKLMHKGVNDLLQTYATLQKHTLDNGIPPAFTFDLEVAGLRNPTSHKKTSFKVDTNRSLKKPSKLEECAYLPVTSLAHLVKTRQVSSLDLTKLYISRLKKYGEQLKCVITLTEKRALEQARKADAEIGQGKYRGPLHGIPWGAKDILAVKGYPTTWGAKPYEKQVLNENAAVVDRLDKAGAVLVAKLSVGALAWGDVWFGGTTKNPWNLEQGSSGSSAGPAAATAAGLVGFSIGTETYGSIISPSARCGVTGLRPTFGRVSRHGCMALSWTLDKIGPMCRSVEDCAAVLSAIIGPDGKDTSVMDRGFMWKPAAHLKKLRIGFVEEAFNEKYDDKEHDLTTLETLKKMGFKPKPLSLPDFPSDELMLILEAEAAAAFDELTRSNRDDLLVRQIEHAWPNVFRIGHLIPAVEYIRAQRIRTQLMRSFQNMMEKVDLFVAPSFAGKTLAMTNLTGHPAVILPNGFRKDKTPTSITFVGQLFGEDTLLAVANQFQNKTTFHTRRPPCCG